MMNDDDDDPRAAREQCGMATAMQLADGDSNDDDDG